MELRTARFGEEHLVSDLAVKVFKPNMKEQFVRLYDSSNIDHMFIGIEDGIIVSSLNYYVAHIKSNYGLFKVGSVGSVCTDQAYRGKGIASMLLEMAEDKMKSEHVDFCIISGRRGMYKRFGARDVGAINKYCFKRENSNHDLEIKKLESYNKDLFELYDKDKIKYLRDENEFIDLWKSQTYPDSYQTYHTYILVKNGKPEAYIIVIDHHEKEFLGIKEYAGDRELVYKGLHQLAFIHQKEYIEIMVPQLDELNRFMKTEKERITQQSTLKIIDQISFLDKLNESLKTYQIIISYQEKENSYIISYEKKKFILDHDTFHFLVFSGLIPDDFDSEGLMILKSIFPIELPWSHNLNYQ